MMLSRISVFFGCALAAITVCGADALTFDSVSVSIGGRRQFLVSGEFHYFRVPKADWRRRLELLKSAGANCVATYIPWCIHEEREGDIRFGDRPERDLDAFLKTVEETGLLALVRPGPFQYSELVYEGLPRWLVEGHPEIRLKNGTEPMAHRSAVNYVHPYFLSKVRTYFHAVADVLRPHLVSRGGCVALVQLDNEMTGVHVWHGYRPDVAYYDDCARYLETLKRYLSEEGIPGPYCHNSGCAEITANYSASVARLGTKDFLLGYDHYYGLSQKDQESPAPYYFFNALFACDILHAFGYPPVGMEIQCGTIGDLPPVFGSDLLACYMTNLAAGMKGVNYYVFTGGPNVEGTGSTVDVYDYNAPVSADGTVDEERYGALVTFGRFLREHPQLLTASRLSSVRLGSEWRHQARLAPYDYGFNRYGMFYSLMLSPYHPQHVLLDRDLEQDGRPLVLAGVTSLSAAAQRRVADFVLAGGSLLVAPDFPRIDLDGKPCTLLADALKAPESKPATVDLQANPCTTVREYRLYGLSPRLSLDDSGAVERSWSVGKGRVTLLAATWTAQFFNQSDLLGTLLKELGAVPTVTSSNRHVFTTAHRLADGRTAVFALNLRPARQTTTVVLPDGSRRDITLGPMSVGYCESSSSHR